MSAEALTEIREYTEDVFIPKLVWLADKYATKEGKKTIQERDYLRAKDFLNKLISEVDNYE